MATSSLDTLSFARRLKEVGFTDMQAEAVTEIIRDARSADLAALASKADIERLEARLELLQRTVSARLVGLIAAATLILLAVRFFG